MELACLDLEGVLIPEIWISFAEKTGIDALKATTRDIPDYNVLMKQRLAILKEHNLGLTEIQEVIAELSPIPGAVEFVDWLRERFQVVILSDTFYEFSQPLMRQLGFPTLLCHKLEVAEDGTITDYKLRQVDPKRQSVNALANKIGDKTIRWCVIQVIARVPLFDLAIINNANMIGHSKSFVLIMRDEHGGDALKA